MKNFALGFDNQADGATLDAAVGAWVNTATVKLDNLKTYPLGEKARTLNADPASTKVRFSLAEPAFIGVLSLEGTNQSVNAAARYLVYTDNTFGALDHDSGWIDAYPAGTIPFGQIPWGAPNWWTGRPLPAEIKRFQRALRYELPNWRYAQYFEIQVSDAGNPDGYFEAGRLMVGQMYRPKHNASYGAALQLKTRTDVDEAKDGTPFFDINTPAMVVPFGFDWLDREEGMRALDLQRLDVHSEVLFLWDTSDVAWSFRRSLFGRLAQLDGVQHPKYSIYRTSFQVEGVL